MKKLLFTVALLALLALLACWPARSARAAGRACVTPSRTARSSPSLATIPTRRRIAPGTVTISAFISTWTVKSTPTACTKDKTRNKNR